MTTPVHPEFFATVSLLSTVEGGRAAVPIVHGEYRGVLALEEEAFSFRFFVESESGLEPGGTAELGFQLLVPELGLPLLLIGKEFRLLEGKVIGKGKITRLRHSG